ncbi:MAG: hypothetical protein IJR93_00570 [Treponema sp.]|nr:hypothetical protein [Treponema sp.]
MSKEETMSFLKELKAWRDRKRYLSRVVEFIIMLAGKARRMGILAIEEYMYDGKDLPRGCGKLEKFLFTQMRRMMTSGADDKELSDFAKNYIESLGAGDADEQAMLALKIGAEGLIYIVRGASEDDIEGHLKKMMKQPPKSVAISGSPAKRLGKLPKPRATPDGTQHLFAVADFLAYVCIKSCRLEKRTLRNGYETDVLRPQTPLLAAFLDGGKLCLPEEENPLTPAEEALFSQLLDMLACGKEEKDVIARANRRLSALASGGQLTLPLMVGAETIAGIRKLELPSYSTYENMAYRLAGTMGHPFCEEYLGWQGGNNCLPDHRERILGQFAKMEELRTQKVRQMEEDWHKDIPAKDVLVRKK